MVSTRTCYAIYQACYEGRPVIERIELYDRAGSHWTWVFILAVGFVSAALTVLLILLDKKAYPKLYSETEEQP